MRCFAPVIDKKTKVLILGSFPGAESLRRQQYYGHPQNLFWRFVGEAISEDLVFMAYPKRLAALKNHRIGLWDVIRTCKRKGSLDSSIKDEQRNRFELIKKRAPDITRIFFNGKKAGRYQKLLEEMGYSTYVLPSTSPANASIPIEVKRREWSKITQE